MVSEHGQALPPGYELDGYQIETVLGAGGFGITYRAREIEINRHVAIKEFLPSGIAMRDGDGSTVRPISASDADDYDYGLGRFRNEAQTLVRFDHPNIVRVHRYFSANDTGYLVMQYIEGEDLDTILARAGTLSEHEILEVLVPILDGLEQVHAAGFLHRDIKPANIYVRADGSPILLDFGAARLALGEKSKSMTAFVSGGYAPIEQYSSRVRQGPWTDIYAVGATLYRAVTGAAPIEAMDRIQDEDVEPVHDAALGTYSKALLGAIDAALLMKGSDRPQSIEAFRQLLEPGRPTGAAAAVPRTPGETLYVGRSLAPAKAPDAAPPPSGTPPPGPSSVPASRGRGVSWRIVAPAAVLVLAGAIGAWVLLGRGESSVCLGNVNAALEAIGKRDLSGASKAIADATSSGCSKQTLANLRLKLATLSAQVKEEEARKKAAEAERKRIEEEKRKAARKAALAQGAPGSTFRDCAGCPEMVVIPGGTFLMGSNSGERNEKPMHRVRTRRFAMGKYEITFAEWDFCVVSGGCSNRPGDKGWGRGNRPVINVSWKDAKQYVAWLSSKTGMRYRLPSEAEWEYAERAGTRTKYWWGNAIGSGKANCNGCGSQWDRQKTAQVGSFRPNRFGLYDVHGNVWEWIEDCYHRSYVGAPRESRPWTTGGNCTMRVLRGGSWYVRPGNLRAANRSMNVTSLRNINIGFRVARTLP